MVKLNTVIVDDDPLNIVDFKECLKPYRDRIEIAAEFRDGMQACEYINDEKPDLAFLDIEMPGLSGFQMLSKLNYSPIVIFVTAYRKFALESFDYSPADFLIKPVDPAKLNRAVQNAIDDYHSNKNERRLSGQQKVSGHLLIKYKDKYGIPRQPFILPDEILYIKTCADDPHYIEILTINGDLHGPIRQSLSQIKKQLNSDIFLNVYKNVVANRTRFVEIIDDRTLVLKGKDHVQIEVSRRYKRLIRQYLQPKD